MLNNNDSTLSENERAMLQMLANLTVDVSMLTRHVLDLYVAQGHTPKEAEALMVKRRKEWAGEALSALLSVGVRETDA